MTAAAGSLMSTRAAGQLSSLELSLKASLLPPEPRDVRLYAFARRTRRLHDGTVSVNIDRPLPIVAIGSVLAAGSEHFAKCEYSNVYLRGRGSGVRDAHRVQTHNANLPYR